MKAEHRDELPPYLITLLEGQYNRLSELDSLRDDIEKQRISVVRQSETCKRLMEIPGVGPLIATAASATMGEASSFKSGREFAAYIGLAPKQTGSGGKIRLPGISKRGDTYLRTLFIHIYPWGKGGSIAGKRAWPMDKRTEKATSDQRSYRGDGKQAGANSMGDSHP